MKEKIRTLPLTAHVRMVLRNGLYAKVSKQMKEKSDG